ncbi:MAG TPA: hypothetical protein VGJ81_05550 [Thermoanaerobaculia bacterium]
MHAHLLCEGDAVVVVDGDRRTRQLRAERGAESDRAYAKTTTASNELVEVENEDNPLPQTEPMASSVSFRSNIT